MNMDNIKPSAQDEQHNFFEKLVATQPVTVRRRILWGDCDPAAVVYTPRFGDYFAAARDWFLRAGIGVLDRPHPARGGISFPMRALAYDFQSFLAADDVMDMRVFVKHISARTFTIDVSALNLATGRVAFVATGTQICFDRDSMTASALPAEIAEALEQYRTLQGI